MVQSSTILGRFEYSVEMDKQESSSWWDKVFFSKFKQIRKLCSKYVH